ncbi:hypothetical protein PTNB85_03977 [Pyrenophora teres f. teres]|nr:hypothetical protein PTNB85_03977 [Pyrenophora teres f. teres]
MTDPTLAKASISLTERSQWPAWFIQFKFHALTKGVWDQVDPDGEEALSINDGEPDLPSPDESLPEESIAMKYSLELTKYRALSSEYTATVNRLMHLWNWVNQTVDQAILTPIMMTLAENEKSTLQALIIELRNEMAPTDQSTENLVRSQYRAHLQRAKQGRQNAEKWQQEWLHLFSKARAYKLSEVEGTLAIQDYLDAITPKLAPEWGRNMHQTIIQQSVLGQTSEQLTLQQVARVFSALLQEHGLRSATNSGVFATFGSSPGPMGPKNSKQSNNKKTCPCGRAHKWSATDCRKLQSALTGKPLTLSGEESNKILEALNDTKYEGLKKVLAKKGWVTPKLGLIEGPNTAKYPGIIQAVLIDPIMLTESHSPGVYSTMDFDAHPLSESTILDNGAAVHLVNNLQLIEPGSFVKASGIDCVEAGTQSFPILGKGTRRIRSILNGSWNVFM